MPASQSQTQNSKAWWVPTIIGLVLLVVPGGVFISPVFFLMAILMRRKNKPKEKSPETPHSLLPLINTQP
jgi:flagellar basal body-associated protein FliL